jgi:hypothetical protein
MAQLKLAPSGQLFGVRSRTLLVGVAAVAIAGAGLGMAWLTARAPAPYVASGAGSAAGIPGFQATVVQPNFQAADAVIAITEAGPGSTVRLLGSREVTPLAVVHLGGTSPVALSRRTHSQVLLSDIISDNLDGREPVHSRLFVLDTTNRLAVVGGGPITLPNRIQYTLYSQALVLSADERLLYYLQSVFCGPNCDDYAIGIVDIDAQTVVASGPLPRDCGFAQLTRHGANVVAVCPNQRSFFEIDMTGAVRNLGTIGNAERPVAGGVNAKGELYLISQDGSLFVQDVDGRQRYVRNLLAPGQHLSGYQRWNLSQNHIALGTKITVDDVMIGILIVNTIDWSSQTYSLPTGSTTLAALDDGEVLVLHGSQVTLLDALTGVVKLGPLATPPSVEILIGPAD